jgi:hypothetical protein
MEFVEDPSPGEGCPVHASGHRMSRTNDGEPPDARVLFRKAQDGVIAAARHRHWVLVYGNRGARQWRHIFEAASMTLEDARIAAEGVLEHAGYPRPPWHLIAAFQAASTPEVPEFEPTASPLVRVGADPLRPEHDRLARARRWH